MPKGSPFTRLCQQAARPARVVVADLHLHTTASDGDYTPDQLAAAAAAAGLTAVAVTDHDTTAGVRATTEAAARLRYGPVVVPGVEISASFDGREVHLLGLFVRPDDTALSTALEALCGGRRERFRGFVAAIPELAPAADAGLARLVEESAVSLGRRHVAGLLVRAGVVATRDEAFRRILGPAARTLRPKPLLPVAEAIRLVRGAGGLASLAHPGPDVGEPELARLREMGLAAIEVAHPALPPGRATELRMIAVRLGLGVTGGSDWHGPGIAGRTVGCRGLTLADWTDLCGRAGPAGGPVRAGRAEPIASALPV